MRPETPYVSRIRESTKGFPDELRPTKPQLREAEALGIPLEKVWSRTRPQIYLTLIGVYATRIGKLAHPEKEITDPTWSFPPFSAEGLRRNVKTIHNASKIQPKAERQSRDEISFNLQMGLPEDDMPELNKNMATERLAKEMYVEILANLRGESHAKILELMEKYCERNAMDEILDELQGIYDGAWVTAERGDQKIEGTIADTLVKDGPFQTLTRVPSMSLFPVKINGKRLKKEQMITVFGSAVKKIEL